MGREGYQSWAINLIRNVHFMKCITESNNQVHQRHDITKNIKHPVLDELGRAVKLHGYKKAWLIRLINNRLLSLFPVKIL